MKQKGNTQQVTFHLKSPKFMVGDIVYSHGFHCVVLSVYKFNIDYSYDLKVIDGEELGKICQEDITGCRLTSEILKKNGWKKNSYYCSDYALDDLHFDSAMLLHIGDHDSLLIDETIKYVHQLQHLLFGLGLNSDMKV